jgi:hypothetical protein
VNGSSTVAHDRHGWAASPRSAIKINDEVSPAQAAQFELAPRIRGRRLRVARASGTVGAISNDSLAGRNDRPAFVLRD